jgi:DNA-binding transcriptional MerR regulator
MDKPLNKDWAELILAAKRLNIKIEEIREFLRCNKK